VFDDLADLDRRIAAALADLRCARALTARSRTAQTSCQEAIAERTLNDLLDRRPLCQLRQQARLLAG
jgi:hypothetical protein